MTAFFIPDTPPGKPTSRAYEDLTEHAALETGRAVRPTRIFQLSCRRGGSDCEISVGVADVGSANTVRAIFDVGDAYAILGEGTIDLLPKRQTYRQVDFD